MLSWGHATLPWLTGPWRPTRPWACSCPCNVIVFEEGEGSVVAAVDPLGLLGVLDNPALREVAHEAERRLRRAVDKLGAG